MTYTANILINNPAGRAVARITYSKKLLVIDDVSPWWKEPERETHALRKLFTALSDLSTMWSGKKEVWSGNDGRPYSWINPVPPELMEVVMPRLVERVQEFVDAGWKLHQKDLNQMEKERKLAEKNNLQLL